MRHARTLKHCHQLMMLLFVLIWSSLLQITKMPAILMLVLTISSSSTEPAGIRMLTGIMRKTMVYGCRISRGKKFFGEPYVDTVTGNIVISVSKSFETASGMKGVVNMDLMLVTLFETMNEIIDSEDGSYGFLTNSEGVILMHPNSEFVSDGEVQYSTSDILGGSYEAGIKEGTAIVDYDGASKYIKSAGVASNGWREILVIPTASYENPINRISVVLLIVTLLSTVITAVAVIIYAGSITKPISRIHKQINHLKELNLKDIDITKIKNKDELGKMNKAVLELQNTLSAIIRQMENSTVTLSTQFENVNDSVNSLITNNTVVRQTINEIFQPLRRKQSRYR